MREWLSRIRRTREVPLRWHPMTKIGESSPALESHAAGGASRGALGSTFLASLWIILRRKVLFTNAMTPRFLRELLIPTTPLSLP